MNILEDLIYFGKFKVEKKVFDKKFVLRTLTAIELEDILKEISGFEAGAATEILKRKILARSIVSINGQAIEIEDDEQEKIGRQNRIQKIEAILGKWEKLLINEAFLKYSEVVAEQNKKFGNINLGESSDGDLIESEEKSSTILESPSVQEKQEA